MYDASSSCFYLDPPYHPDTRARLSRSHGYRHELSAADHEQLLDAILAASGSIVLSGFAHPTYEVLAQAGFQRLEFSHHITASLSPSGRRQMREVIWRRVAAGHNLTPSLWDELA